MKNQYKITYLDNNKTIRQQVIHAGSRVDLLNLLPDHYKLITVEDIE